MIAPSRDIRTPILDSCDEVWAAFRARLVGMSDDEYLWEPVSGCWSVRAGVDGARIDGDPGDDPDPAPVTTIAWRLWHIAVDCLDGYSTREFGRAGSSVVAGAWHLRPEPALADLDAAWATFRSHAEERSEEAWSVALGDTWGPYAHLSFAHLVLHALHEVTHHGAEVALLRDLYRVRG